MLLLPSRYEARVRLAINSKASASAGAEALAQAAGVSDPTKLQTQVGILETDSLAWQVIKAMRLDQKADALPRRMIVGRPLCETPAGVPADSISDVCKQTLIDEFHERLHVQAVPRTDILEIRYRSRSPILAAQVVDKVAEQYGERSFNDRYAAALQSSGWLQSRLDDVRNDAETAQLKYLQYQKQSGLVGDEGTQSLKGTELAALNQQMIAAQSERIVQEARYRTAQDNDPEALVSIAQGSTLQTLHAEQITLESQYAQLDAKFGSAYPRVIQVKEQLAKANEAAAAELEHTRRKIGTDYEAAKRTEDLVQQAYQQKKEQAFNSNEAVVKLALLKRDVDADYELYEQVVKRVRTGNVMAGVGESDITLIDPAQNPTKPAEPHMIVDVLGGAMAGALGGILLIGLLEAFDSRSRTLRDVTAMCPMPGVGLLPLWNSRDLDGKAMVKGNALTGTSVIDFPASRTAEVYRSIRTVLLHSNSPCGQIILVTSPFRREGKTEVSLNLAAAIAGADRRVLLVDADSREAQLSRMLGVGAPGLADLLHGDASPGTYMNAPGIPGLSVLSRGTPSGQPFDGFDSQTMKSLVADWRSRYDVIVLDGAQVLDSSEARTLSTVADSVLLVVRAAQGRRNDIRRAIQILQSVGARLNGGVVTFAGRDVLEHRSNHASA